MSRTTRSWLLLLCGVVVVLAEAHAAEGGDTAVEIAEKARGSTVQLVLENANGQQVSQGSGFLIGEGEIASNCHVVKGMVRGYAKLFGQETKHEIEGRIAVDCEMDLVVLKISGTGSRVLTLGDSDSVLVGETVYAVGNPSGGGEATFTKGIVSSTDPKHLQIDASIWYGSSGGPVLNEVGEVIGISRGGVPGGGLLNYAIKVNYLRSLLLDAGPVEPLPLAQAPTEAELSGRADKDGQETVSTVLEQLQNDGLWGEITLEAGGMRQIRVEDLAADTVSVREVIGPLQLRPAVYALAEIRSAREIGVHRIPKQMAPYRPPKSTALAFTLEALLPGFGYFYAGEFGQGYAMLGVTAIAGGTAWATGRNGAAGWMPLLAWTKVASLLHLRDQVRAANAVHRARETEALLGEGAVMDRPVPLAELRLRF